MSPHRCKLQISIVIGHVVKHVGHGNHHRWVGGRLLLSLIIVIIIVVLLLFLWLLETTEDGGGQGADGRKRSQVNLGGRQEKKKIRTLHVGERMLPRAH